MTSIQKNLNNRLHLHPVTLAFEDSSREEEFLEFYFSHYAENMRISMLLGILVWGLFGLIEIWFYPKTLLWSILVIRYLFVLPMMTASFLLTYLKNLRNHVGFAIALGITACAFGTIAKFASLPNGFPYNPVPSLITIFLYGYAVMRARFKWASATGLAIIIFYAIVATLIRHHPIQDLAIDSFFLIMVNFIGMYVCYSLERFARRDFVYSHRLKTEKIKTDQTNEQLKVEITERYLVEEKLRHHQENLEQLVHMRTKDLEATQHEMIHMLGLAAEYRDCETGQHIKRMSYYCVALAQAIGLPQNARELLFYASQMHDVGKLGIPDKILLKPGKLTKEEWDVMKKHTSIGAEILSKDHSPLLDTARNIALLHHEKWDGGGYPKGIKKENIPMLARVVCLCDVFDALTSDRPYKDAWSTDEALREIERLSGSCFDPFLVIKFKEIFPIVLKIYKDFSDTTPKQKQTLEKSTKPKKQKRTKYESK
ncbi:MAG: HD domain-containing protein [Candidatus Aceula meridiana]|nr:HD domain-containing protein [Candidatus Aceula meridiana]